MSILDDSALVSAVNPDMVIEPQAAVRFPRLILRRAEPLLRLSTERQDRLYGYAGVTGPIPLGGVWSRGAPASFLDLPERQPSCAAYHLMHSPDLSRILRKSQHHDVGAT